MKFLCVPCDQPMKLVTVRPPDEGSLSVVYACPACGYEMALLTNPYETQLVSSLGVKIGAGTDAASAPAGSGCPFSAMVPGMESTAASEDEAVSWSPQAAARLGSIPEFVRPMARTSIERFARERGYAEVDEKVLDEARAFYGM